MAPVIRALSRHARRFETFVCLTSQHREMLDQVLGLFAIPVDHDLRVMTENQSLSQLTARIIDKLDPVYRQARPDIVIVQGDTMTTFCAALVAFYHKIPVAHVEAGLRTYDLGNPFPEEASRVMTSVLTALHLAPTQQARDNLLLEKISPERIAVTGNTAIDALLQAARLPFKVPSLLRPLAAPGRKILLTAHRRENHGAPLADICRAAQRLLREISDLRIFFPVHLNPQVNRVVRDMLGDEERAHLLPPLDYHAFVHAMKSVDLILTDSGGVQEEAPSLGKPVLVLRQTTERPEGIAAGGTRLVGTDPDRIVEETTRLLQDRLAYAQMARIKNPYGDGRAAQRIVAACAKFLGAEARPYSKRDIAAAVQANTSSFASMSAWPPSPPGPA